MRFYDLIMNDADVPDEIKNELDGATVISCDNVAQFYYEISDQEYWDQDDFPNVAPPLPYFWLDFTAPKQIISEETGIQAWGDVRPSHWGFLCVGTLLTKGTIADFLSDTTWKETSHALAPYIQQGQAKWGLDVYFLWRRRDRFEGPIWMWRLLIGEDGRPVQNGKGSIITATGPGAVISDGLDALVPTSGLPYDMMKEEMYKSALSYYHTAMLSLSFMHCKNVIQEEVHPPKKRVYNKSRKRRGEKDYQPVSYKVLNIQPMKEVLRREGNSDAVGAQVAMHICRGHFKHFDESKPLFGKYHGTYWWSMHVRGSKKEGIATKDYRIQLL